MKKIVLLFLFLSFFLGSTVGAYTIVPGDTMSKIAQKSNLSLTDLISLNSQISNPDLIFPGQILNIGGSYSVPEVNEKLGTSLPVAGTTYTLAGSGVTASTNSITLQSLTIPQTGRELVDSDFSDTFYITFEPGSTKRQEITSCTTVTQNANNTATLSGCSRGLLPFSPYTASSTYAFPHGGGTQLIFSDPPQLFNEYTSKTNNETIAKRWFFDVLPEASTTLLATTTNQLVTKQYADGLSFAGSPTSTESTVGRVKLGTQAQMAASTYDANEPSVVYTRYSTSTPYTTGYWNVISESDGKLNQSWLDLTEGYSWSGAQTHSGGDLFTASSTFAVTTTFNGPLVGVYNFSNTFGTTGEAINGISTPIPVAIATTTSNYLKADGDDRTRVQFVGFIITNAGSGTQPKVITDGIVEGFSGLTPGANYYVSDSIGTISLTQGTTIIPVGKALTATKLLIQKGKKIATASVSHTGNAGATENIDIDVGFKPSFIIGNYVINSVGDANTSRPTKGIAFWKGTTLTGTTATGANEATTAITGNNISTYTRDSATSVRSLSIDTGTNGSYGTISISSLTNTGFVSRYVNTADLGAGKASSGNTVNYTIFE